MTAHKSCIHRDRHAARTQPQFPRPRGQLTRPATIDKHQASCIRRLSEWFCCDSHCLLSVEGASWFIPSLGSLGRASLSNRWSRSLEGDTTRYSPEPEPLAQSGAVWVVAEEWYKWLGSGASWLFSICLVIELTVEQPWRTCYGTSPPGPIRWWRPTNPGRHTLARPRCCTSGGDALHEPGDPRRPKSTSRGHRKPVRQTVGQRLGLKSLGIPRPYPRNHSRAPAPSVSSDHAELERTPESRLRADPRSASDDRMQGR